EQENDSEQDFDVPSCFLILIVLLLLVVLLIIILLFVASSNLRDGAAHIPLTRVAIVRIVRRPWEYRAPRDRPLALGDERSLPGMMPNEADRRNCDGSPGASPSRGDDCGLRVADCGLGSAGALPSRLV